MTSPHERWRRDLLTSAETLQPHKQAMLRKLIDSGTMHHHCDFIRIRLSCGVPISKVRDEFKAVVEILEEYSEVGEKQ